MDFHKTARSVESNQSTLKHSREHVCGNANHTGVYYVMSLELTNNAKIFLFRLKLFGDCASSPSDNLCTIVCLKTPAGLDLQISREIEESAWRGETLDFNIARGTTDPGYRQLTRVISH